MKEININQEDIIRNLATKIANLEIQLATEVSARKAVIKYAESLEAALEQNGIKIENEEDNAK